MKWQTNGYMDYEKIETRAIEIILEEQRSMTEYTEAQLTKKIYERYPVTEKEKQGCIQETLKNRALRDRYKKELKGEKVENKKHYD